mgnify:CR=1 FL=1
MAKVAIMGYGTVGSGVYEIIKTNAERVAQNAGEKIALAYGNDKVEAIYGALKTGVIDTLITDEYTAKAILAI